jgi:precorrin-2/cobalt-factor-2 C20-methyltransferase
MIRTGSFYGIGVGPGDPDLLTVKAVNILKNVDAVYIPRSGPANDCVALNAAGIYISPEAEIVEISTPMTRDPAVLQAEWHKGAEKIAACLKNGKNAAFITIGDSMLFSTYTYLMKKVAKIVPDAHIESVPGITSFSAAAAFLNTALAEGVEKLAIVPAIESLGELRDILTQFPNAVLMKVAGKYNQIVDILEEMGLKNKAVYISRLGYDNQSVCYDLDSLRNVKRDYLSLILVKREGV